MVWYPLGRTIRLCLLLQRGEIRMTIAGFCQRVSCCSRPGILKMMHTGPAVSGNLDCWRNRDGYLQRRISRSGWIAFDREQHSE